MNALDSMRVLPPHVAALQTLVDRCPTAEDRKYLIATAGSCGAVTPDECSTVLSANQLETA